MTLRARITISVVGLLLVVIATVGVVASRSVESILVGEIDRVLVEFSKRGPAGPQPPEGVSPPDDQSLVRRDTAETMLDGHGDVVWVKPSGFTDDPDPLPDVTSTDIGGEPVTIPSIDGSIEYRAIALELPGDMTLIRAFPLDIVTSSTASLIQVLLIAGGVVLLAGAGLAWWLVTRSTRPVDRMVETAEEIAAGDLSQRVGDFDADTDFGKLASSLNQMMSTIEESVERERAGQERLRQFVADASHELRTPITAIAGYAELESKGGLATAEEAEKAWGRIRSESGRMSTLVEDLLVLTRLGEVAPSTSELVDLVAVVRASVEDHRTIDASRPVHVTAPTSTLVMGDPERLHQVVSNLLENVRVHTPEGTSVEVSVERHPGHVVLSVADDGPGIPEDSVGKVFDRFYRADPSRSRRSGGSGLGLAIVEAIVEAHGGSIRAENAGGARFVITLPGRS